MKLRKRAIRRQDFARYQADHRTTEALNVVAHEVVRPANQET
jgi:hypothetical protein